MSSKGIGFFNSQEVTGLLDHTERVGLTARIGADVTGVFIGERKTAGAQLNGVVQDAEGLSQFPGLGRRFAKNIQGQPGCGLSPDAGQTGEIIDELFESRRDDLHGNL
jgi:hypothetical protein